MSESSCSSARWAVSFAITKAVSIAPALSGIPPRGLSAKRTSGAGFPRYPPGVDEARPLRLRFVPILADTDVHSQRRIEVVGAAHLRAHELACVRDLGLGNLEQELVVHLQDEAGTAALVAQAGLGCPPPHLCDVGGRAPHGG